MRARALRAHTFTAYEARFFEHLQREDERVLPIEQSWSRSHEAHRRHEQEHAAGSDAAEAAKKAVAAVAADVQALARQMVALQAQQQEVLGALRGGEGGSEDAGEARASLRRK